MAAIFHTSVRVNSLFTTGAWRRALARVIARLADAPLEQSVVRSAPAATRRGFGKPHAHWHTVTGADGRPHLVAEWHRQD
ncbi:hypothetical protein H9Y04_21155 [Streptomyces sp. TRM66268-LWL]|uniref:Uncharacterized protein n=1 Tax=Streptomyces polyasparticus TaxID=2767826 RepID=A0ABR7SL56_9ACTN|nr:hypothetical protein [Streptomyces polyasparticus]MBC9715063.1 hypothetical protein [Streptomyces polyasparticus]